MLRRRLASPDEVDPYVPVVMPSFGTIVMPDPRVIAALIQHGKRKKADAADAVTARVHVVEMAEQLAAEATKRPTGEARELGDRVCLKLGEREYQQWVHDRMASEVRWGLSFARPDADRMAERPPVVRDMFLHAVVSRTTMAEGTGRIGATALCVGFLIGRGGPTTLADGLYDLPPLRPGAPPPPSR